MEITKLENIFKDKTPITFGLVNEDGSVHEETYNIFHWPILDHKTEEMMNEGATLLARLLAAEGDTDNPIPVVTRQLRLLGVYSEDLTVDGKPLFFTDSSSGLSDEEMKKVPLSIQRKIAMDICAPVMRMMAAGQGNSNVQSDTESETTGSTEEDSTADHAEAANSSASGG